MDDFLKALAALVFFIGANWINEKVKENKEKREKAKKRQRSGVEFTSEVHLKVKDEENKIMRAFRPCRMFVYHFHNGEVSEAGLHLFKITIRHEVVEISSVQYMTDHYQGKPIPEMFYQIIKDTFTDHYHFVAGVESIQEENPPLRDFMVAWDIGSMLFLGLANKSGKVDSVLAMHWPRPNAVNHKQILQLRIAKNSIERIYQDNLNQRDD